MPSRKAKRFGELIEGTKLRKQLTALTIDGDGSSFEVRGEVLKLLKETLSTGHKTAETLLMEDGSGTLCAERISHLMDEIIRALYDFTVAHVYRAKNPSSAEQMAVVAVGGYGRGTLAPGSDIDLLFLLPYKQTPWGEQVIEYMLYMLWDLGLKVGHATRNINECVRLSKTDTTIKTAVLEARYIWGAEELFDELIERFDVEVVKGTGPEFIELKLAERDERHRKAGESRYLVEPNVKEGKGGLRDLHTLFWIGKYYYRVRTAQELIEKGVYSRREYNSFRKAEDFLWAVRCHMHFLTGKAEERLHFDIQRDIADRLGYTTHPGLSAVERFMKHYFLVAKDVGDLTRIFCAALEEEQAKDVPGFNNLFRAFSRRKRKIAGTSDFIIDNHRINVADPEVFERDPVNLIRMFWFADKHGFLYHPQALKLATRSTKLIGKAVRTDPEANRLFMDILTSERNPELNLRRMNESGVLGRFIPDFGKIVAMMQFNMYHHYTVDEHLLRCVGVLSEIDHGQGGDKHPLAHTLLPMLKDRRDIIYLAVFVHDIAKGRPEDHSIAGAKVARRLALRLGFTKDDAETVAWLVENHLVMSMTAQARDLNDRKTIEDFETIVQSKERLRLLLALTVCDIRGVGPGVWNGWKGQLLRTLYYETELLISGGFSEVARSDRAKQAREALSAALEDWSAKERKQYLALLYDNYLLTVDIEDQKRHAEFIRQTKQDGKKLATMVKTHTFHAVTEITIVAPDHPRLLAIIAGACSAAGANIVDAQIFTTADGRALDTILINREFELDEDELRRAARVSKTIEDVLAGNRYLPQVIEARKKGRGAKAFRVTPKAEVRNALSHKFSVIEIEGLDRPGLLSDVTGAISDLSLDIASAHITTFGEKIIDTFYVTDLVGQKINDSERQERIKKTLTAIIAGEKPAKAIQRQAAE